MSLNVSVVIPVYGGSKTIGPLVDRLFAELHDHLCEVVLVNDDSPDDSDTVCREIARQYYPRVRYARLSRNFGEHNAVMAGLSIAGGSFCVIMDDDFQNPPSEVIKLVEAAETGQHDVVYSYYARKRHSLFRNLGSKLNNIAATWLIGKPYGLYLSSFKCINRWLCDEILKYTGPYPYIDGLILRTTSRIGRVEVRHDLRSEGRSYYTISKLCGLWMRVFLNFSVIPLRISAIAGFAMSFLGLIFGLMTIWEKLTFPETPVGWASTVTITLVFSGVQLVMLGLVGEYLGRLYLTVNRMPQFAIREVLP